MGPCLLIVCCLSMPLALDVLHAVAGRRTHRRHASTDNLLRWMHVILVVARVGEREKDLLHNKLQNYRYFPSGDARRVPATCTHSADHMANTSKENRLAYQRTKENTQNANYVTVNWNVVNADDAWMLSVAGIRHIVAECVHQKGVNIQIHSVAHIYDRMRQTFGVRLKIKIALPSTTIYRLQLEDPGEMLFTLSYLSEHWHYAAHFVFECNWCSVSVVSLLLSTFSLPLAILRYTVIVAKQDWFCMLCASDARET